MIDFYSREGVYLYIEWEKFFPLTATAAATTNNNNNNKNNKQLGGQSDGFGTVSKSGSIGTVSGRFWVPKAEYSPEENQGSVRNSPRAAGHQISSIIRVPPRSFAYRRGAFSE